MKALSRIAPGLEKGRAAFFFAESLFDIGEVRLFATKTSLFFCVDSAMIAGPIIESKAGTIPALYNSERKGLMKE